MCSKRTEAEEDSIINLFCGLNDAVIINKPDPPEAVIQYKDHRFDWIEVTSTRLGQSQRKQVQLAKALNCNDSPGSHGFIFHCKYPFGYFKTLEEDLLEAIEQKNSKISYQFYLEKYGPGILIIDLEDPLYGTEEPEQIIIPCPSKELSYFRSIFIHLNSVHELRKGTIHSTPPKLITVIFK
jgi:hypothetical protein